jgi:hypothetical protein
MVVVSGLTDLLPSAIEQLIQNQLLPSARERNTAVYSTGENSPAQAQ